MSDYISREATVNALKKMFKESDMLYEWQSGVVDSVRLVEKLPAADVAPVRHGRWEYFVEESNGLKFGRFKCSLCGKERPLKVFYGNAFNYCPSCGADMRGER